MKVYGVDCVIRHFEGIGGLPEKLKEASPSAWRTSRRYRGQMQYPQVPPRGMADRFRRGRRRLQVADQAAHEHLSGQRWSWKAALDVLWARALITDGLHDEYWKEKRSREEAEEPVFAA